MKRLVLAIACLFALPYSAARADSLPFARTAAPGADEVAAQHDIGEKVRTAIAAEDFVALNRMEQDFQTSRARMPDGWWKLAVYHRFLRHELGTGLVPTDGCEYRKADFVQRWSEATPRSPAAFITAARLRIDQAWCVRGSGFSNDVPNNAWPKFEADIAAAAQILDRHGWAAKDPEFTAIQVDILRSQHNDLEQVQALVDKATAREPDYFPIYDNAVMSFMPQWGGSWAAVDQFAHYAAQRSAATEHSGFYARIYISLEECGCVPIRRHPDWQTMKQGMRDIYALYPVIWNGNHYATYACRIGDTDEGKRYIRAMYPPTDDEHSFVALFASCDNEAARSQAMGSD